MRRPLVLLGLFALVGTVAASRSTPPAARGKTERVTVHCSNGQNEAFVTPQQVEISLGDSVVWRMAGNVASDSVIITLKDTTQVWPFVGQPPRGGASARANAARRVGTYGYNVTLYCRVPGGGTRMEIIDPDIIIGE